MSAHAAEVDDEMPRFPTEARVCAGSSLIPGVNKFGLVAWFRATKRPVRGCANPLL